MDFIEGLFYMIWRGAAIGIIISAPMGPVGILCVQRTLEKGRRTGFHTGVGAALSDLFYCLLTGFGLSLIEDFLKANQNVIQIIGSAVLLVFGIYLFKSNPAKTLKKPGEQESSPKKNILSGFLFTFSNPLIIFLIIGLFARFNFLSPDISPVHYIVGFVSIFAGALLWWWIVSFFVNKVRRHFNMRSMWLVNKIMGSIIMIFSIVGVFTAVSNMASAAPSTAVYLNSVRGFGETSSGNNAPLLLSGGEKDTLKWFLPANTDSDFTLRLKARLIKGNDLSFILANDSDEESIVRLKLEKGSDDGIYPNSVSLYSIPGQTVPTSVSNIGSPQDWNSFELKLVGTSLALAAGNRGYNPLGIMEMPGDISRVGIMVLPGNSVETNWISLETNGQNPRKRDKMSHFGIPGVRESYFMRSTDALEGEWVEFDRTLDESKLKSGGRYHVAIVRDGSRYSLLYIDGAIKNTDNWKPGQCKAILNPTAFDGIYDVEWFDPKGMPLAGEIHAQREGDLLLFQFVDHGSRLRMRKCTATAYSY